MTKKNPGSSSKKRGGKSATAGGSSTPTTGARHLPHIMLPAPTTITLGGANGNALIASSPEGESSLLFTLSFSPPTKPWSTNQDRNLSKHERHSMIQAWKLITMVEYRNARLGNQPPGLVLITIPFDTNRTRDPHNYCGTVVKAIIDGLVKGGAWPDDTPEYVGHLEPWLTVQSHDSSYVWVDVFAAARYVLKDGMWTVVG